MSPVPPTSSLRIPVFWDPAPLALLNIPVLPPPNVTSSGVGLATPDCPALPLLLLLLLRGDSEASTQNALLQWHCRLPVRPYYSSSSTRTAGSCRHGGDADSESARDSESDSTQRLPLKA